MSISLEQACQSAKYMTEALATAGRPDPPPAPEPDLPVPGGQVTEEHIVLLAGRGQNGASYLTSTQRKRLFRQLMAADVRRSAPVHLQEIDDVWLCRMLMNAWSVEFTQKAFGRPFIGAPRLATKRFK